MKKEERIQSAYGDLYNKSIDDNGWMRLSVKTPKDLVRYFIDNKHIFNTKVETTPDEYKTYFRPKSLQGIENNNGWIKIESEDDLPKEDGFYWVVDSETKDIIDRYFDTKNYDYFNQFSTHYQSIQKPKPPLY